MRKALFELLEILKNNSKTWEEAEIDKPHAPLQCQITVRCQDCACSYTFEPDLTKIAKIVDSK